MRGYLRDKVAWRALFTAMFFLLSATLCACSPHRPPAPTETVSESRVTEPSDTDISLPNDPVLVKGLPGDREDRITVAVNDPDHFNLNPFATGTHLFPVDPSGYYQPVYRTLFVFEPVLLSYRPILAKSFELSDQGIQIVLHEDQLWHDDYPFTAQDVLFTISVHQKWETDKGEVFSRYITGMSTEGDSVLKISVDRNEKRAGWHVLDALSRMPVVASHIWSSAVAGVPDADSLPEGSVRVVGTGPWKFYQEDAGSISFVRHSGGEEPDLPFLTVLKYAQTSFAYYAIENSEIDLLIGDVDKGSKDFRLKAPITDSQENPDLHYVYSGQVSGGLAINYAGRPELGRRAFRHLLVAIANHDETGMSWSDYPIEIASTDVLSTPAVMKKLDRGALESASEEAAEDLFEVLIEEAGMERLPGGEIVWNGEPFKPLTLVYPVHSARAAAACFYYAEIAAEQGIKVLLQPVLKSEWQRKLSSGEYQLAYMESSVNETFVETVERVASIPGRKDGEFIAGEEFDVVRARAVFDNLPANHSRYDMTDYYQELAEWMIQERLFIPLGAGYSKAALQNREVQKSLPFDSLFTYRAYTRPSSPSK
ncbi:MAG: ABC transporter substrate-binding protein [Saccharofermentanales bacterium]|jgi:hypothetical protein